MSHPIPYRIENPAPATVGVDSLHLVAGDSLSVDSLSVEELVCEVETETATTLDTQLLSFLKPNDTPLSTRYREVEAEELFGHTSLRAEIPFGGELHPALTATPAFSLLVMAILAFYCLMLYQHLADAVQLISRVTRERATGERLSEESNGGYSRFLNLCALSGILLAGVAAIRFVAPWLYLTPLAAWPRSGAFLGAAAIAVALCVVWGGRIAISALVGQLTYTGHLFEQLFLLKRTFFALATLIATPFLGLWLLTPIGEGKIWFWVTIITLIVSLVLYLYETLSLFISKKISILHWFLYLCGVEIFPISLLILLIVR